MPAQAIQSHSKSIWSDSAAGGGVLEAAPRFFRYDSSDVVITAIIPEQLVAYAINGDYMLLDLVPMVLVADGSDIVPSASGTAVAALVDGGGSDIDLSATLSLPTVADLLDDATGDFWLISRTADRLNAVAVGADIQLY